MGAVRDFEEAVERLAAGPGRCPNYGEATESCRCIVCRTRTLLTEWEDHRLFAALEGTCPTCKDDRTVEAGPSGATYSIPCPDCPATPDQPNCGGSGVTSGSGNPYDEDPVVNCPGCNHPECPVGIEDCDDLCVCDHVRHEHRYHPDPECGPETGRCVCCPCERFQLAKDGE